MKKYLLLGALLLVLALALIGYGSLNESAGLGSKPPALTVRCGENSVKALRGTYSWSYVQDGQGVGVEADSVHPLEAKDSMSPLAVAREDSSAVAQLEFEVAPDTVSVCAWDTAFWNRTDVEAQAVDVAVDEELVLLPYDAVYSVTATWDKEKDCGGTAHYSFYTESVLAEE